MDLKDKILDGGATLADQEEALKYPDSAYYFACCVKGADIGRCCKAACRSPKLAYFFAKYIPGADIERCCEAVCEDYCYAYMFAYDIEGADMVRIKELCPEIGDDIDKLIMERVLI